MSRVKVKDTDPELKVRRMLRRLGYRYRLQGSKLPGKPDIVFPGRKKAIFVNGCFWHGHKGCPRSKLPETNRDFWEKKIARNVKRDRSSISALRKTGWDVLVVWECEMRNEKKLERKLFNFMEE